MVPPYPELTRCIALTIGGEITVSGRWHIEIFEDTPIDP